MGINERVSKIPKGLIFNFVCFAALLVSCEQRVEGCLDFRALDVDVIADDACADCCIFPSLELNFIPVRFDADTVSAVLRSTDSLFISSTIAVLPQLGFYLHDIYLISEDGEGLAMQDTFTVFSGSEDPNFVFESSLLRITPFRQTSYELGTLLDPKTFVAVEAKLGLPDILRAADIDVQPVGSPLNRNADSLLVSVLGNESLDMDFRYEQQDGSIQTVQLPDGQSQSIRWELPTPVVYEPSFNLIISLGIPADLLLQLDNGTVNGSVFVTDFLEQSEVLETLLSRS